MVEGFRGLEEEFRLRPGSPRRAGWVGGWGRFVGHLIGFNGYFDLRAFFQFHLVALFVDQAIRDADLAIQMICAFEPNLRFLGLATVGMRMDNFLYLAGKFSTCF